MSVQVDVNGTSINYPRTGDTGWGGEATQFAIQVGGAFSKLGLDTGTTVDIPGTLDVTGATTLDSTLDVGSNLDVTGNTNLSGTLDVTGNTTLTGNLTVNGNTQLGNANTDTTAVTGILNVDSGVLYVDPTTNKVGINDATPSVELDVNGSVAITGNETVGGTLGISNGTASAPSLTPSGDTNTGLYSIGSDKIGFAANGIRQGEFGVGYGGFTGNIIQVVSGELTTRATTSSASFVDTGLSATITPKYSTSKILVLVNLTIGPGTNTLIQWNLLRGSTNIAQSTGATFNATGGGYSESGASAGNVPIGTSTSFLDSPSTISSTTYKVQFRSINSGITVAIGGRAVDNNYGGYCSIILLEVQQ